MYVLPNMAKHAAQKKWFCLEKNGNILQYAKSMHQPEYDDSILHLVYSSPPIFIPRPLAILQLSSPSMCTTTFCDHMKGISLEESYCRLATATANKAGKGERIKPTNEIQLNKS